MINHRSAVCHLDADSYNQKNRNRDNDSDERSDDIDDPLHDGLFNLQSLVIPRKQQRRIKQIQFHRTPKQNV